MSAWHRKEPLERDICSEWDGVVIMAPDGRWIRYLDRCGNVSEDISPRRATV